MTVYKRERLKNVNNEYIVTPSMADMVYYPNGETVEQKYNDLLSDLDKKELDLKSEINDLRIEALPREFNKEIGFQPWYRGELDSNGDRTIPNSDEILRTKLKPIKEWYLDGIIMPVHINYSNTLNKFYIEGGDIQNLERVYNFCQEMGIRVKGIKIHQSFTKSVITQLGSSFQNLYKEKVLEVANTFKGRNIEYFTVMNESSYYTEIENENFMITLIRSVRNLGYKTSISLAGFFFQGGFHYLPESLRQEVDFFACNCYVRLGTKLNKTTVIDSICSWKTHEFWLYAQYMKETYGKDLIFSETGIQDWYECYAQPSNSAWSSTTVSNGETSLVYYTGLFESLKNSLLVKEVWAWYDINYEKTKPLFKKYLTEGGNK